MVKAFNIFVNVGIFYLCSNNNYVGIIMEQIYCTILAKSVRCN